MNRSKGFSLIEVLVTLLLVTVGLLGVVALQSRGIQFTQDSVQRNSAIELSNQLLELMRANAVEIFDETRPAYPANKGIKNSSLFLKAKGSDFSPAPSVPTPEECMAPQTAEDQRNCWLEQVKSKLPKADTLLTNQFYICRSSTPGNCNNQGSTLEVQLAWHVKDDTCPDDNAPDKNTCIYRTRIEL